MNMAQFLNHQQLPIKMEASPAESYLSAPGDNYTSLFTGQSSAASSPSMAPFEAMTPVSSLPYEALSPVPMGSPVLSAAGGGSKKKRKSWGQVLPEPKTNLPPRKRAKTADEKEQRRVERVLRNRRAAQSSRERKRHEVELLEQRNRELEDKLQLLHQNNIRLEQELQRVQRANGQTPSAASFTSPLDRTLASDLFTNDEPSFKAAAKPDTINLSMASLSPPPDDLDLETVKDDPQPQAFQLPTTSDVTQHSAAMLCDLPCPSESVRNRETQAWAWMMYLVMMLRVSVLSAWQRPLTQISLSLKTHSPLVPSPTVLTTVLWLVTRVKPSKRHSKCPTSSTSRRSTNVLRSLGWLPPATDLTSSTSTKVTNLKVKLLRKILSCSPNLARPLADATFEALRLASSESHNLTVNTPVDEKMSSPVVDGELTELLKNMSLPPRETLLALAWTLRVEMKKMASRKQSSSMIVMGSKLDAMSSRHGLPGVNESVALPDAAVEA